MPELRKDVSYYRSLPYPAEIIPSESGGFVAFHPHLPGCSAQGADVAEALRRLKEGRDLWLQAKFEDGERIPEPPTHEPSGRLMLRVPVRLHASLDALAQAYGKSLNRLLNELLFNHVNALPVDYGLAASSDSNGEGSKTVASYRFSYWLTASPEGGFVAEHPDLPGCFTEGDDLEEALENLEEARELWLEGREEEGLPVPEPLSTRHTGVIHLRMPPALHADLIREALRNGTTLNQMIGFVLGVAVGTLLERVTIVDWTSEHQRKILLAALALLRKNPFRDDPGAFASLPKRTTSFLRVLIHLERRNFPDVYIHLTEATADNLDFSKEAVEIFRSIPERPSYPLLHSRIMEWTHYQVDLSTLEPTQYEQTKFLKFRLVEFLEGVKGDYARLRDWEESEQSELRKVS